MILGKFGEIWAKYPLSPKKGYNLLILEIINYRRVKNQIVSSEATPTSIFGHDWTFKLFYCDVPNCGITFELLKLVKKNAKLGKKLIICKILHDF